MKGPPLGKVCTPYDERRKREGDLGGNRDGGLVTINIITAGVRGEAPSSTLHALASVSFILVAFTATR